MNTPLTSIEQQVRAYCAQIGSDPLLVQGAGGNVSWKDGQVLWVKASGTWLADAVAADIFVPVDLPALTAAISIGDFLAPPKVMGRSRHKPSIETVLHGLMPHQYVVHLHHIEALAYLVRVDAREQLMQLVGGFSKPIFVEYFKPGADLARAIFDELQAHPESNLIFLKNHGVVIGGQSIDEIASLIARLSSALKNAGIIECQDILPDLPSLMIGGKYKRSNDKCVNSLATNPELFNRLTSDWALYPDHIVFLGPKPIVLDEVPSESAFGALDRVAPPFIFVSNIGVFESNNCTNAQRLQLRCYYDVLVRQKPSDGLSVLSDADISSLLNWDAEKYRQATSLLMGK